MTEPNASDLAEVPAGTSAEQRVTRKGMWGQGSGDTSGYGGIVRSFERFPRSDRPYGSYFDEIVDRLRGLLPSVDLDHVVVAHDAVSYTHLTLPTIYSV